MNTLPLPLAERDHRAEWTGDELAARDDWIVDISPGEVDELKNAAARVRESGQSLEQTAQEDYPLPTLGPRLHSIQHSLEHGSGATLIRGLSLDNASDDDAGWLFWALSQHLGAPVSQSASGERIFSVSDAGFGEKDSRARGPNTRKRLHFHTDRCDVIGFLCVRPAASGGENEIVSSVKLYHRIRDARPDLCRVLMDSFYYQRHNVDRGNVAAYCQQPIFSFCEGRFAANFLRVLIDRAYASGDTPEMTDAQREALDCLEQTAEDESLRHRFRLQSGEILFLNNWVTLHRRAEFTDFPDAARKRLLLRAWLAMPNSRPLDERFACNYGDTAAGAIRGGMKPL